jgi:hypothetical protein
MGLGAHKQCKAHYCWSDGSGQRWESLMKTMDALNRRYGRQTVSVFASSAPRSWVHASGKHVTLLHQQVERSAGGASLMLTGYRMGCRPSPPKM